MTTAKPKLTGVLVTDSARHRRTSRHSGGVPQRPNIPRPARMVYMSSEVGIGLSYPRLYDPGASRVLHIHQANRIG